MEFQQNDVTIRFLEMCNYLIASEKERSMTFLRYASSVNFRDQEQKKKYFNGEVTRIREHTQNV